MLEDIGRRVVQRALAAWERDIMDPPRHSLGDPSFDADRAYIDGFIRDDLRLGGVKDPATFRYRRDGDYEWCGAFAGHAWAPYLAPELLQLYFPSTYRLDCFGRYLPGFATKNARSIAARWHRPVDSGYARRYLRLTAKSVVEDVAAFEPRAGDILLVGTRPGLSYGSHVCLVERWDPKDKVFHTVEGNATGRGPRGDRRQGVVRQVRPLGTARPREQSHALRLIRPGLFDLVEGVR